MHVLVVEDDAAIGELMAWVLAAEAYQATVVCTTTEALSHMESGEIDLIIADLEHGHHGAGIWQRIIQLRQSAPRTPIIVCTAYGEATKVLPAEHAVSAIITKPFELDDFITQVGAFKELTSPSSLVAPDAPMSLASQ